MYTAIAKLNLAHISQFNLTHPCFVQVYHQSDGVYGPLIINQPQPLEPHSSIYDYDRSKENTLIIAAKMPELLTAKLEDVSKLKPDALIINGDGDISK